MSESRPFGDGLCAAVRHYLHQNNKTHLGQINAEILADIAERYFLHHEAQTKAKKKRSEGSPEEAAIYDAYPRKVGRVDALAAIRVARDAHPSADLLARTQDFARCVGRWPKSYRYKDGSDMCPYPATWFRAGRYLDDPKEWLPAGLFSRPDDPPENNGHRPIQAALVEPLGWLEEFPNSTFKDWKEVPQDSRKAICDHMNKQRI